MPSRLRFSWVLINELAVGSAPRTSAHLDQLQRQGIASVLSLCSIDEAAPPEAIADRFVVERVVLPYRRSNRLPAPSELQTALEALQRLKQQGLCMCTVPLRWSAHRWSVWPGWSPGTASCRRQHWTI